MKTFENVGIKSFFRKVYQVSKKKFKILITGGAGMIGSNLVKKLVLEKYKVFVADNLWRGKMEYLYTDGKMVIPRKNFYKLDLRNQ